MHDERLDALIEGAMLWADAGVPVFPCKGNKAPLTKRGFYDAVTAPGDVRTLFEFYGDGTKFIGARMGAQSGLFAMDFDLYKGDQPRNYMEKLIAEGCLPGSRTHQTLKGGLHVFYKSDTEWPNLVPCPGVEVKGEGGYVIVPPSPGYTVLQEGIVDAPSALLQALQVAQDVSADMSIDDLKVKVMEAHDLHDSLRGIAAKLSAQGLDVIDVMVEIKRILQGSMAADPNHQRHIRWRKLLNNEGEELTRMIKSGYTKYNPNYTDEEGRKALAGKGKAAASAGFFEDGSPSKGKEPTVYPTDEWPFESGYFADEEHNLKDQLFTMYPIFAENESVVLFAEPKTGKTAVALTTALHIACGFDLGALKVYSAGPTLYYALEGSRAIRLRVAAWRKRKREEGVEIPERIPMYVVEGHANFLKEEKRQDEANKIIAANEYAINSGAGALKAVYLDTLTKAMSGGDQNSVEDTSHLFDLIGLLRAGGVTATIIFVHHKSRAGNARGSTNIEAEPDVLLDISKKDDAVCMRVARARSIEDGGKYMFRLSGVDLGETSQGHPLAGVYAEPMAAEDEEEEAETGLNEVKTSQLRLIAALGEGTHTLREVLKHLINAGKGPEAQRGKPYRAASYKTKPVQMFFIALVGNNGTFYRDVGIRLIRDKNEIIMAIKVV